MNPRRGLRSPRTGRNPGPPSSRPGRRRCGRRLADAPGHPPPDPRGPQRDRAADLLQGLRPGVPARRLRLFGAEMASLLDRVRQPFNVNAVAQAAAAAALDDQEFRAACIRENRRGLERLQAGFAALGLEFVPSSSGSASPRLYRNDTDPRTWSCQCDRLATTCRTVANVPLC